MKKKNSLLRVPQIREGRKNTKINKQTNRNERNDDEWRKQRSKNVVLRILNHILHK